MKICFACREKFTDHAWECPACAFTPSVVDGYLEFSQHLAKVNPGFKASYFSELAALEDDNFWFKARNRLIIWALGQYFPKASHFFEIGCGTGFVLSGVRKAYPHLRLYGSEIFTAGLVHAGKRLPDANLFQMDAREIPFANEFDVIGAFDVLEHIKEDETVLSQLYQAVRPGGGIILTVPQHQFLWSQQDVLSCHVRRYSANDLKDKVRRAGFKVVKTTSFVSLLLPFMLASRLLKRHSDTELYDPMAELKLPGLLNTAFEKALDIERFFIRFGVPFSLGGSLLLIASKG